MAIELLSSKGRWKIIKMILLRLNLLVPIVFTNQTIGNAWPRSSYHAVCRDLTPPHDEEDNHRDFYLSLTLTHFCTMHGHFLPGPIIFIERQFNFVFSQRIWLRRLFLCLHYSSPLYALQKVRIYVFKFRRFSTSRMFYGRSKLNKWAKVTSTNTLSCSLSRH